MNNLAYNSQDAAVVGPKVEEKVREEIGAGSPVVYTVEQGNAGPSTVGAFLHNIGTQLVGGAEETLFHLHFDLQQPRCAHLQVSLNRQGVGCHVGLLLYSAPLARPVSGEIYLEDPKMLGKSKFIGDATACAKLNANGDLLKHVNDLARTESQAGGQTIKIKRYCRIVPEGNGSSLVLATLSRPTKMGFGATIDAQAFFEIANAIEKTL